MIVANIEEMYCRYFPIIREKCGRMLRDPSEAQDVAQETFTRLWEKRSSLTNPEAIPSWIYRTSTRITIDRYRSLNKTNRTDVPEFGNAVEPRAQLEARQVLAMLASRIPRKELEIALFSRVDGMTHDDIAIVMDVSDRTIRRLLKRFDERIRSIQKEVMA